jgi:hypothetical protein
MPADAEIISNGATVWVNTDICLGRFGRLGVDIHHDGAGQLQGLHCLDCFERTADLDRDWERFKGAMLAHHNVVVDDSYKPTRG